MLVVPSSVINLGSKMRQDHRGMRHLHSTDSRRRCQEYSIGRRGLSRVDIVAILGCIAIAIALFLPRLVANREQSRLGVCAARQFRTALALQQFDNQFLELPGYRHLQALSPTGEAVGIGWAFPCLPYLVPLREALTVRSETGERSIEGTEPFAIDSNEQLVFRPTSYLDIVTRHGPSGPSGVAGTAPTELIPELQCPAVWLAVRSDSQVPRHFLSWRVATGLVDQPWALPPDFPESACFVDRLDPTQGPVTSLAKIEEWDGRSHTILFAEGTETNPWTSSAEREVGLVAAWPAPGADLKAIATEAIGNGIEQGLIGAGPDLAERSDAELNAIRAQWVWAAVEPGTGGQRSAPWPQASSFHASGINVTFADGSTREIGRDIDQRIWIELLMPNTSQARFPGSNQLIQPLLP